MIVDTSALVAILKLESDGPLYEAALAASPVNRISAATYLEVSIVIDRVRDPLLSRRLDEFLATTAVIRSRRRASPGRWCVGVRRVTTRRAIGARVADRAPGRAE